MADLLEEQARQILETVHELQQHIVKIHAQHFSPMDLTLPQFHALRVVGEHGSMGIKELAEVLQVSAPSASAMVDRLVDMEMVERRPSRADRRAVEIRLTEKGTACVESHKMVFFSFAKDLLREVGPECAEKWCEVYACLRDVIRNDAMPKRDNGPELEPRA